jgi:hypothetical protein
MGVAICASSSTPQIDKYILYSGNPCDLLGFSLAMN